MRGLAIAVALVAACGKSGDRAPEPGPAPAPPPVDAAVRAAAPDAAPRAARQRFPDATAALSSILGPEVRILGIGELHERAGAAAVQSAIGRFRAMFDAQLARRASDLIVEVWARDACGEKSAQASKQVQQMTQRPATTENEIVTLMKSARAAGVSNHVLELHCSDYDSIVDARKEIDYEKLLQLVTKKLLGQALIVAGERKRNPPPPPRDLVVLYGGALHNNRYPDPSIADFSYATSLVRMYGPAYVELDLYVPEYADGDKVLMTEPWYPNLKDAGSDHVLLIQRGPGSYILILERGKQR
ncbi:MAG TPA: hypothetical protein VL172_07765 [Kofleriaceae bacterium]|nr:hypothetical protein [Kofleriaceae bacterium]